MTNMKDEALERIIRYKLEPINVSVHTTNPELRCMMLHNRFAGKIMEQLQKLYEGGIVMNGQIVLCKNVNDGEELERSIRDLSGFIPNIESVSVVPVGLSDHREGLYPLEPFNREDAREVIACIEKWQKKRMRSMVHTLSMLRMNGIFWRDMRCRTKNFTTVTLSWKMAWV